MAVGKSGSFELTGTKGITVKVFWSEEYFADTEQSVVSIDKLQVKSSLYSYVAYYLNGPITVAGTEVIKFSAVMGSHNADLRGLNSYIDVKAAGNYPSPPWKTGKITHNEDGTLSVAISLNISGATSSGGSGSGWTVSGSQTVALTTFPKSAVISSVSGVTLGNPCSVSWKPASASFRFKLKFSMGSWSQTTGIIHPNTNKAYTYTGYAIPLEAARQIPNDPEGTMTVTLYTYSDSSATALVGTADSDTFKVTVPDNANTKPNAKTMTLAPVSSLDSAFAGLYIQGYSKVRMTSTEEGQLGADIKSKTMTVEGKIYGSSSGYTSDFLTGYGNVNVMLTLEDSRGFVNTKTLQIAVIPYSLPRVVNTNDEKSIVCARCDSSGNLTDSGTYLKIKARRGYALCMVNGVQKNFCGLRYRYKEADDIYYGNWIELLPAADISTEEVDSPPLLGGTLSASTSYVVQVDAVDSIPNNTPITFNIPTDRVYMHKAGNINALAIGKYAEIANTVDIASDIAVIVRNSINGVFMATKTVSGVSSFDIQTKYADFTGNGNERQTLFLFGAANASLVYGLARVSNNGTTQWQGTTGVTLSTKSGGILTVTLPTTAYDLFTIISSRKFTA